MKTRFSFLSFLLLFLTFAATAQTVSPGRQTIDKQDIFGLNLTTSIPEKQLKEYWQSYLSKYGKVKGKKGTVGLERAIIPTVSSRSLNYQSTTTSSKNITTLFLAISDGSNYITNATDEAYVGAENMLKDFLGYATAQEELRLVKQDFTKSQDEQKKMIRDKDKLRKNIEKTEKDLERLRKELSQKEIDIENFNSILQNKQKGVEDFQKRNSN